MRMRRMASSFRPAPMRAIYPGMSTPGLCPVDLALNFLNLCHAQTCGKCVPCRVGLGQLSILLGDVLEGRAKPRHMEFIEETAQSFSRGKR